MKNTILLLCYVITFLNVQAGFKQSCKEALKQIPDGTITYKSKNNWLYTRSELRHLSVGDFIGKNAAKVSQCTRADRANPELAIIDFAKQIEKLKIKLIIVPVPPKAGIYPEGIDAKYKSNEALAVLKKFYKRLKLNNIEVLDMSNDFIANKTKNPYCQTDSHWSSYGCELTAKHLSQYIMKLPWYKDVIKTKFSAKTKNVKIIGDLSKSLKSNPPQTEIIPVRFISGLTTSKNSPILLMGDSHTLIFHTGDDMLTKNAGLVDQLAYNLKLPINLLAVRGSGATAVRISLYRKAKKANYLDNIKVIIWCFTSRDFTESSSGWRKVPVKK